ncbi:MAG TPA: hypothetical protein DDY98_05970 [Ruminococcaceae bacterium]|nr:hypothetical protein [Oscillospiraceae bacterium]
MLTPKIGVLKDMYHQLRKYCALCTVNLEHWEYRKGHFDDGIYTMADATEAFDRGDRWTATYDEAHFFTTSVTVPEEMAGKELRLEFNVGGEALVRVNGAIVGSVSTCNRAPERGTILLKETYNAGDKLEICLEAGINSMDYCDKMLAGAVNDTYDFGTAYLWTPDYACEGYWFDIEIALEALDYIKDEHIKALVYAAIDDSLHEVDYDFDEKAVRESIARARKLYAERIAKIPWSATSSVIFTGHSHIDVAWLWRVQESIRKSARTFSNVVSMMDKYPEMTFGQSQAVLYQMVKDHYPDLYEKIKEKVANGQWDICGNVWVEADTNIASGEALIRQVLYGTEFFKKEFGKVSKTYWLPDCFGFTWALPQIINRCGMTNFITSKLSYNDTNKFPFNMFRWQGNDGTQVMAHMMNPGYNGMFSIGELMIYDKECNNKEQLDTAMGMYGYGDGGGGPTYWMLERGRRLQNFPGLPQAKIDHVDNFFDITAEHKDELPVWNGEMYYENHRGTFTSQAFVKKNNRKGEYALVLNEMLSVFADLVGNYDYPKEKLEAAWRILMTNQFHDILPGTSIHQVFEDCQNTYATLRAENAELRESSLAALNKQVKTEGESLICWNLTNTAYTMPITFEAKSRDLVPVDEAGNAYPCAFEEKDGKLLCTFTPCALPAMGVKVIAFGKAESAAQKVTATETLLENEKLRVVFDENGIITSIYDKVNDRETLDGQGNLLTVSLDKCIHETAWNLETNYRKKMWELVKADRITVSESNAQRGVIEIVRSFNKSVITQKIILNANSDLLFFDTEVDWHETDKVLKAGFDVAVIDTDATYNIAHGAIRRPTHWNTSFDFTRFEVAAHKWADLSEGDYGVSILNDCKYGYDIHNSRMRITLMRAPTCPDKTGDHGISTFVYAYYPHKNSWQQAQTVENGIMLNIPPVTQLVGKQDGAVADGTTFMEISADSLTVECFKPAQDGNGFILRLAEQKHGRGKATVKLRNTFKSVTECNMIEEDETELAKAQNEFSFAFRPYEVKTFRIVF